MIKQSDIEKLAELSRIGISDEEKGSFTRDLDAIVAYVSEIREAHSEAETPEAGILRNVMRPDEHPHESGCYTEAILREVPVRDGNYVRVKQIL